MNGKVVSTVAVCLAIIAAAVAGVIVTGNRAAEARAKAAKAESDEARAASEAKKAKAEESAEASRAAAAASEAEKALQNRKAKEAERDAERLALAKAKEEKAKSEADAEAAKARAREAADLRAAEKAKSDAEKAAAESAMAVAEAEERKAEAEAQAAADTLATEKLKSDAIIAEENLLYLRKINFEEIERDLIEYRQELDERERALHPDKTAADLTWVGEREADVIGGETNRVRRTAKPLPENDMQLPRETRALAKAERLAAEGDAARAAETRAELVATLERLYIAALREDRVVDADYYRKSLKSFYPDWELKLAEEGEKEEK